MKTTSFLASLFFVAAASASSMSTPEATMQFMSADGKPVAGVSLSASLGFSVIVAEDCTGFICMPSFPHRVHKSDGGGVLGKTDTNGQLRIENREWSTSKLTAKDLSVSFFTNGTIDVTCGDGDVENIAGFVELLPQWGRWKTSRTRLRLFKLGIPQRR